MGINLYKITGEYAEIMDQVEADDGEVSDAAFARLEQINADADEKLEMLAKVVRNTLAESEALKKEATHLSDRATSAANKAVRIKDYICDTMVLLNISKVKGQILNVTLTKPRQSVEYDVDNIDPKWYIEQESRLDKKGITNALKNGFAVAGAQFVEGKQSVLIK